MTLDPLVSVVVPVHNKVAYVAACLESIRSQTYDRLEVLCIDDGSDDGSSDVLAEFARRDVRFRVVTTAGRTGEGAARNRGLDEATGEAVFFVDADDWIERDAIARLVELRRATGADLVRGSLVVHRPHGSESGYGRSGDIAYVGPPMDVSGTLATPIWGVWVYLYSLGFVRARRLRFSGLALGVDTLFLAQALVAAERLATVPDVVYHWRQDPESTYASDEQLDGHLVAYAMVRDVLIDGCFPRVWSHTYGRDVANYLIAMLDRGIRFAVRPRVARGVYAILTEGPHPVRLSRTLLVARLVGGVVLGRAHFRLERAVMVIRRASRSVAKGARRAPARLYGAAPAGVHRTWRRLKRSVSRDAEFAPER